jgi:hypothetical protein
VKIFNIDVLPTWQAQIFSTKDSWPNIDDHLDKLQLFWDMYLGNDYPLKIDKNTDAYHKVSEFQLSSAFQTFIDVILGES